MESGQNQLIDGVMLLSEMICKECGYTFPHTQLLRVCIAGKTPLHFCPDCKAPGPRFNIPDKARVTFTITKSDLFGDDE